MNLSSCAKLNNGVEMPWLGLGVFLSEEGAEVENAVKTALKAFEESLEKLQTDYLDLYLIHWPKGERSVESWKALEELYAAGRVRAIGVSNFLVHHLEDFLPTCKVQPAVNQVEFHPELIQPGLLKYCQQKGIQPEAWSPIMKGRVNDIPVMQELAAKYGKTPVQIVLRWDIQKGVVTIPKSVKAERIISNANIFDFELSTEDMAKIDALDKSQRIGSHPDHISY